MATPAGGDSALPRPKIAQTRAKVSRVKADMRSTATALESNAVDHNVYPWPADQFGNVLVLPTTEWFETKIGPNITTPVAYLGSRFPDLFHPPVSANEDQVYHLMTRAYALAEEGNDASYNQCLRALLVLGNNVGVVRWAQLGHGPELSHLEPDEDPQVYDPTNGTLSRGNILMFGPGIGFSN